MAEIKNFGVIEGQRPEDYIAGASPIPYEERNPSGDWTPYLPPGEWQKNHIVDTYGCVSFSGLNSLEVQYKFITGKERNFSDRFTVKMSGTTPGVGNYLYKVGDSIRVDGIVDESVWPAPLNYTQDVYYAEIPQSVKDEAKKFLEGWGVEYEWVDVDKPNLIKHLKHSPLQVVIPGHAVLDFYTTDQLIKYFDSYEPFIKEVQSVMWAFKYVLTPKKKHMTKEEVLALQVLEGYSDPAGADYWAGKPLAEYLKARLPDKIKQEQSALNEL